MLQNRVDPMGNLICTPARGAWMGTRGVIHNDKQMIVRPFKLRAWITCKLEFKGRKRPVMAPRCYTELFFLDEATAFAAGHRPCAECRRGDYNAFKSCWLEGNPAYEWNKKTSIQQIDGVLQKERIRSDYSKVTYEETPERLPDGAFILLRDVPYLVYKGQIHPWSPSGYGMPVDLPRAEKLIVLTPRSVVHAFHAGYKPQTAFDHVVIYAAPRAQRPTEKQV